MGEKTKKDNRKEVRAWFPLSLAYSLLSLLCSHASRDVWLVIEETIAPVAGPRHVNELPAKITATGAIEEGIARVINEPDVLLVAGRRRRVGELAAVADGLARGTLARTIVSGQRGGGCW